MKPSIKTVTGRYFDFVDLESNHVTIQDVAKGLSNCCRFSGQIEEFYSVAQHSVLVSYFVTPEFALAGLLHDSAEAYIHDISAPLKQLLPDYRAIEHRVDEFLMSHFGVRWDNATVKAADLVALATEKRDLIHADDGTDYWSVIDGVKPDPILIRPWAPKYARREFLARFVELTQ